MKRRNFISSVVSGAALAPMACGAVEKSEIKKLKWDEETDVVVVGYGGAGAAAAIEATDNGAKVLILEKMPFGGGNTAISGGGITIPKSGSDAQKFFDGTFNFANNEKSPKLVEVFCREIREQMPWLLSLCPGIETYLYRRARYTMLPNSDTIEKFGVRGDGMRSGPCLWHILSTGVSNRKIQVMFETPVKQLILDKGSVVGVIAEHKGSPKTIRARKAVILTCGGFENNQEMLANYTQGKDILNLGTPANTGDGVDMAIQAGAKIWRMTAYSCPIGARIPGKCAATTVGIPSSGFWVDQSGRRFADEKGTDLHAALYEVNVYNSAKLCYPRIPAFLIFDKKAFEKGSYGFRVAEGSKRIPYFGWIGWQEKFVWSPDGKKELEAGVIRKYANAEEAAKGEGLNPVLFKETLERWNRDVKNGCDTEFGRMMSRGKNILSEPLEGEEIYVMSLYPALLNTQGGPEHNEKSQVISVNGSVIPHLYAAGELGSMWGTIYEGGTNLGECLVFGRIAGKNAAQEKDLK